MQTIYHAVASQMWQLFQVLPLILCNYPVEDDDHYECFLKLQEICSIIFAPMISSEQTAYLPTLISDYLQAFKQLYPTTSLTPKFHYLIHIPRMIQRYIG